MTRGWNGAWLNKQRNHRAYAFQGHHLSFRAGGGDPDEPAIVHLIFGRCAEEEREEWTADDKLHVKAQMQQPED